MKRLALVTSVLSAFAFSGCVAATDPGDQGVDPSLDSSATPPADASGVSWTREVSAERAKARGRVVGNMTNHGGPIMKNAAITAIFWGTSWPTDTSDKISGIDSWYTGYAGSNYASTVTEYTGTNGTVSTATTYGGHIIDSSASTGGGNTGTILSEVCKAINNSPAPGGNGYYPVYTDTPRGSAGYCAWHASGTCPGSSTMLTFAYFFKLDGDAGCDPKDTSGLHSQGLAALANVTGHELSEMETDPSTTTATGAGAWYDSAGAENGDKCAWTWGAPLLTFSNGTKWKVQGNWSNKLFTAGTGYANSSGQKGCAGTQ